MQISCPTWIYNLSGLYLDIGMVRSTYTMRGARRILNTGTELTSQSCPQTTADGPFLVGYKQGVCLCVH